MATLTATGPRLLRRGAPDYPEELKHLPQPPERLYAQGRLELLEGATLAIVGTRAATPDGLEFATLVAEAVAAAGGVVISGLALGIDAAAHRASLPDTVAVLGCGLDRAYPWRHRRLQEQIAQDGLLLSEFEPGTPPMPYNFPRRNRIIAALASVVLVVEAPETSGAVITGNIALDLGRDVLAVPGPPRRRTSRGTNKMIKDGAILVTEPAEVLQALGLDPADVPPAPGTAPLAAECLSPEARLTWLALGSEPLHVDEIGRAAGLRSSAVAGALLELELIGRTHRLPGQRYRRD